MNTRDYLDQVETILQGAVERGVRQRRVPRELLVAAPALIAVAAVVAALLTLTGGARQHRPPVRPTGSGAYAGSRSTTGPVEQQTPTATTPTTSTAAQGTTGSGAGSGAAAPSGPVPAGFAPSSFTAIGESTWWLLGQAPCGSPPCTSIVRTDDGGRSFVGIPAPRTSQVAQLRFADPRDGFAYGPQLWVTHDQGAHWSQVSIGGNVTQLAASGGYVYAIVAPGSGSGPALLKRSPVASDSWSTLRSVFPGGLWVNGQTVIADGATASGLTVLTSTDGGSTFSSHAAPPSINCSYEALGDAIWAPCATGMMSGVWRSTDSGASWTPRTGRPGGSQPPQEPNFAPFGAATATTAVYGYNQLYRTTDGGASWVKTGPSGISHWQYVGFTDPTHGVAIGETSGGAEQLFYTTDGGASYHQVTVG